MAMQASGTRRSKIEALREREALKEHRGRLQSMLSQKLVHKYGVPSKGAPVNKKIATVVTEFMGTHSKITEADLVMLEEGVAHAIGKPLVAGSGPLGGAGLRSLGGSQSMPSIASARPGTTGGSRQPSARGANPNAPASMAASGARPGTTMFPQQFPTTNEWTLLDTYNAIENEELTKQSHQIVKTRQREFKAELDGQVERSSYKAKEEKMGDHVYLSEQTRMLENWKASQEAAQKLIKDRNLEEKRVREKQIEARKSMRDKERSDRRAREEKELSLCRREIKRQEQLVLEKRASERARLQSIRVENAKENEIRSKRAAFDASEDQRLMVEYKEKLDKEESDRASAFARRMARLEQFSAKSGNEEGGAVFEQLKQDREFEAIVLRDALKKEESDLARERHDKEKLRANKVKMAHENKRLMEAKNVHTKKLAEEETQYAQRFRREGEEYLREEHERFKSSRLKSIDHQAALAGQIEATRSANAKVDMSEREREMNRSMLLKVAGDPSLMEKIKGKLTIGQQARAKSAPTIGFSDYDDDEDA